MLLMNADPQSTTYSAYPTTPASRPGTAGTQAGRQSGGATGTATGAGMLAANPNGQGTEEAVRAFMNEVCIPLTPVPLTPAPFAGSRGAGEDGEVG